jgi:hypothetical protein
VKYFPQRPFWTFVLRKDLARRRARFRSQPLENKILSFVLPMYCIVAVIGITQLVLDAYFKEEPGIFIVFLFLTLLFFAWLLGMFLHFLLNEIRQDMSLPTGWLKSVWRIITWRKPD